MFLLANDPGQASVWPVCLQASYNRQYVRGITQRRQPQDADGFGW